MTQHTQLDWSRTNEDGEAYKEIDDNTFFAIQCLASKNGFILILIFSHKFPLPRHLPRAMCQRQH